MWPSPVTTYLVEVSSARPMGPRACSFWVRDADLGAEAELAPVGEAGRGVDHDGRGVHLGDERPGRRLVLGDDGLGMTGRPAADVRDRVVQRVDNPAAMSSE